MDTLNHQEEDKVKNTKLKLVMYRLTEIFTVVGMGIMLLKGKMSLSELNTASIFYVLLIYSKVNAELIKKDKKLSRKMNVLFTGVAMLLIVSSVYYYLTGLMYLVYIPAIFLPIYCCIFVVILRRYIK